MAGNGIEQNNNNIIDEPHDILEEHIDNHNKDFILPKWASSTTFSTNSDLCLSNALVTSGIFITSGLIKNTVASEAMISLTLSQVTDPQRIPKLFTLERRESFILFKAVRNNTLGCFGKLYPKLFNFFRISGKITPGNVLPLLVDDV